MAVDERLADRIRAALAERDDVVEQRMFGGIAFLVSGRMACGVVGDELMARVGREAYEAALARPHVRPMDFTGRPLRGLVFVGPAGTRTLAAVRRWVEQAVPVALAARPSPKRRRPPSQRRARRR